MDEFQSLVQFGGATVFLTWVVQFVKFANEKLYGEKLGQKPIPIDYRVLLFVLDILFVGVWYLAVHTGNQSLLEQLVTEANNLLEPAFVVMTTLFGLSLSATATYRVGNALRVPTLTYKVPKEAKAA